MFKRAPTRVSSNQALVAAGGSVGDVGITTRPTGTVMPDFQVVANQKPQGWFAKVHLHLEGSEGTNNAAYLAAGDYPTGKGEWAHHAIGPYVAAHCPAGEITGRVSQNISNLSRTAETEHCNDVLRAYAITVEAATGAIRAARDHGQFGPRPKRAAVMTEVRNAICHGLDPRLARIFTNAIQVGAMVDRHRFKRELADLFINVCDLTLGRDNNGNHTFVLGAASQPGMFSWIFGGSTGDIRDVIQGPHFLVPGAATVGLIHL